jgi:hypothetical protein
MITPDRFRTTKHGRITMVRPTHAGPGSRHTIEVWTADGKKHATRLEGDSVAANKIFNRLADRLNFQLPTVEQVAS